MKSRLLSQIFVPILLILLIMVIVTASASTTFAVGTPKPTPTAEINSHLNSSSTPALSPASRYPDQAHITDGIILWGMVIVAIIILGIFCGRRKIG